MDYEKSIKRVIESLYNEDDPNRKALPPIIQMAVIGAVVGTMAELAKDASEYPGETRSHKEIMLEWGVTKEHVEKALS